MASSHSSKTTSFKLSLIRHGVTMENLMGIYQGRLDTKLAEEGVRQAKRLAKRIATVEYTHVICSPLQRTRDTTRLALSLNKHENIVKIDGRIMERSFGSWEGKKFNETSGTPRIGGERWSDVFVRVKSFLNDLYALMASKCEKSREIPHVLVVTHGGVISAVLKHFKDDYKLDVLLASEKPIGNTSVTTFVLKISEQKNPKLLNVSCILDRDSSHLDSEGFVLSHI